MQTAFFVVVGARARAVSFEVDVLVCMVGSTWAGDLFAFVGSGCCGGLVEGGEDLESW